MAAAPRPRASKLLLLALLASWTCSRDSSTALDLRLALTGEIDEVAIQRVDIDGAPVDLTGEKTLFPASPRRLADGDVITIWFADSADSHAVAVTAVGRWCGQVVTDPMTTDSKTLMKDARTEATLALVVNRAASCDGGADRPATGGGGAGGGGAGRGGGGGTAGGAGGVGGSGGGVAGGAGSGAAGAGAGAGAGGSSVGRGGAAGGVAGAQGGGGAAGTTGGRGGAAGTTTGGSGGAAGTAGRGGTSGGSGGGGGSPTCSGTSDGVCPGSCVPCQATCGANQDVDCKFPNGSACAHVIQCSSGNCVDGTCCNSPCAGACDSCSTGTCTVSASGATGSPSCSPYRCNGTSAACPTSCASDANCVTTAYCTNAQACAPTKSNGTTCAGDNECTSGICVDGYCCNGRCTGACDRCNRAGSLGMCVAAPAGSAPTVSCGVYLCDGTATGCPTSCSSSSACASGYSCQSNTCQTCRAAGGACASTNPSICCSGSCVSFQCQ